MNRTERLLNLLQILRGNRYHISGNYLAEQLNISIRTLYRDIAILKSQGARIEGEVGVGYILKPSFFLPPMMLTRDEVYALILGSQWVSQYGDASLSKASTNALSKILDVLPNNMRNSTNAFSLRVGPPVSENMIEEDLSELRNAILNKNKVEIVYQLQDGKQKLQIVCPFAIGYFTKERILAAWSEEQNNYQHFNTSKIISLTTLEECYTMAKETLFHDWRKLQLLKHAE